VTAGVIYAHNNGHFKFYDSIIRENMALSIKVGEVFDSANENVVKNNTISKNLKLTKQDVLDEI
jgi:parallel beta-helix repeat protein